MGRPLATLPPAFETLCGVSGGSDGQGPGERGRRGHAGQGDGGDQAIIQCGSGEESGSLPAGESVPAWARCEGGSAAAAADWRRRREKQAFALVNMARGLSRVGRAFMP